MKRTVVITAFPYPLIWDRGYFDIRIADKIFEVDFLRRYRQQDEGIPSPSFSPGISKSSNSEMHFDRLTRVAYTLVNIWFPMRVEWDKHKEIQGWIHAVINRLLEVYRYQTGEFHVDAIPINELWEYEIMDTNEDGTTFPSSVKCRRYFPLGSGVSLARIAPVPTEARQLLRDGTKLPIPRTLYLNAKREELLENYRLAVVEAETAFETLVDQTVSQYYKEQGLSSTSIENKLQTSLKNLIKHHIPQACGQHFKGTAEHAAWESNLYRLRNEVVHEGASVSADEAHKALEAAGQALQWIEANKTV